MSDRDSRQSGFWNWHDFNIGQITLVSFGVLLTAVIGGIGISQLLGDDAQTEGSLTQGIDDEETTLPDEQVAGPSESTEEDRDETDPIAPAEDDSTTSPIDTTTTTEPTTTTEARSSQAAEWPNCPETPVAPTTSETLSADDNDCPRLRVDFLAAFSTREVAYELTAGQSVVMDHRTNGAIFDIEVLDPQEGTALQGRSNGTAVYEWTAGADGTYLVRLTPDRQNSAAYVDIRVFDIT